MAHIYLAMVDTPGVFAYLIRRFLGQKYIHVVISMDEGMEEAYSFGRRNPRIPLSAGFEKEDKEKILRAFPTADYMVCELMCSEEQKNNIRRQLEEDYRQRWHLHYAVLGLPFIVWGRPFYQRGHYTCSSYIARLLRENGIYVSEKHFSLITPKDFWFYPDKRVVFEGSLAELVERTGVAEAKAVPGGEGRAGTETLFEEGNVSEMETFPEKGRLVAAYGRWF